MDFTSFFYPVLSGYTSLLVCGYLYLFICFFFFFQYGLLDSVFPVAMIPDTR